VFDQIDFRDALLGGVAVVDLFTIDEQDHVRILFYGAAICAMQHRRLTNLLVWNGEIKHGLFTFGSDAQHSIPKEVAFAKLLQLVVFQNAAYSLIKARVGAWSR